MIEQDVLEIRRLTLQIDNRLSKIEKGIDNLQKEDQNLWLKPSARLDDSDLKKITDVFYASLKTISFDVKEKCDKLARYLDEDCRRDILEHFSEFDYASEHPSLEEALKNSSLAFIDASARKIEFDGIALNYVLTYISKGFRNYFNFYVPK